ncbi:hypothetical protein D477_012243 [Arthrobacter crystallopoietes BAB-32]|uniref:Uncharacterized protein n=1 Tax=Arthrobacter crystallopoietes BAB-32 TaxID=1246476 RepID=N1UU45_9MICC|nr:hypothetical protein D477_012243 [Arthrobacter crystallopoietes BAB-32]
MSGNLIARSIHDLTAGAWFGGSLMGAVGLNGAAAEARDAAERTRLSSLGWKRWAPVQMGAFLAHLGSGVPLIIDNSRRLTEQHGVMRLTVYKTIVTLTGAAVTAYAGMLGRKVEMLSPEGAEGATEPGPTSSEELAKAQKQLKVLQWMVPVFAGWVMVLGAKEGEMQRVENVALGMKKRNGIRGLINMARMEAAGLGLAAPTQIRAWSPFRRR